MKLGTCETHVSQREQEGNQAGEHLHTGRQTQGGVQKRTGLALSGLEKLATELLFVLKKMLLLLFCSPPIIII